MPAPSTYRLEETPPKKRRWWLLIIPAVIVVVALAWYFLWRDAPVGAPTESTAIEEQAPASPEEVSGRYMFSGTVVLARTVENDAKTANGYDYTQPFEKMSTFKPAQYDEWIVDWECPTTDTITLSYAEQVAKTQFNCRPAWLPEFSKYFTAVNLANNHTNDLGVDVFAETKQHLLDSGLQVVGNYDPGEAKDVCEVMALTVHIKRTDGSSEEGELPVAYCAWHYFFRTPLAGEVEVAKKYAEVMPVFGLMHAGVEYRPTADDIQQAVAHRIIDSGAEFVIGNSPHWIQNSEVYKGKPIFYSTGNFIFDQDETETMRGLNIAVDMSVPYDDNVAAWLELGKQCTKHKDTCLQQAKQQGLEKIQPTLVYEPIASSTGLHELTRKASPAIQAFAKDRLNWAATKESLGQ